MKVTRRPTNFEAAPAAELVGCNRCANIGVTSRPECTTIGVTLFVFPKAAIWRVARMGIEIAITVLTSLAADFCQMSSATLTSY